VDINVAGRVNNIDLPITKPLLPLFESVVNSIDAVGEKGGRLGSIGVEIIREDKQEDYIDKVHSNPVAGFKVSDDGVGFDSENYKSFCTSDSPYKARKGCKGIGRFLWLKSFQSVHVSSAFEEGGKFYNREFDFCLSEGGVENEELVELSEVGAVSTQVVLEGYKPHYQKNCPKKATTVAQKIIEHCLSFFLSGVCPKITLYDYGESINLNRLFEEEYLSNSEKVSVRVGDYDFSVSYVRVFNRESINHAIHYCANNREVVSQKLVDFIPDLRVQPETLEGKPFTFLAYVSGELLDKYVNSARTDFNIARSSDIEFDDMPSLNAIRDVIIESISEQLAGHLRKVKDEKVKKISQFVQRKPQYRHVLKYGKQAVGDMSPILSEESLEMELFRVSQTIELDVKQQSSKYLKGKISDIKDYPGYRERYNRFVEKLNDVGKSNLAKYIVHRRIVLDLFSNCLNVDDDGRYALEEGVHEIIFPLKTTSEDVDYSHQNLWMIDEKLAYHHYLASDIPFNKMDVGVESAERPDLIVFNNPSVFADQKSGFSSIVIVEFKRPMRNDYNTEENPIAQVLRYVRKIRAGKQVDRNGRPVNITENTPIYTYIVCDMAQKIREVAEDHTLTSSPDNMGYFGYIPRLKTYVEVISFDKLVQDAEKRNQVLFEQLYM